MHSPYAVKRIVNFLSFYLDQSEQYKEEYDFDTMIKDI
jgi:hypothetical protein